MRKVVGKCPLCGNEVTEESKGYFCLANKKEAEKPCSFVLWKEIAGKEITESIATSLLEKGKTSTLKGFRSKAGKSFEARLKLEEGKVDFVFENRKGTK